jgi:hypothetical protein
MSQTAKSKRLQFSSKKFRTKPTHQLIFRASSDDFRKIKTPKIISLSGGRLIYINEYMLLFQEILHLYMLMVLEDFHLKGQNVRVGYASTLPANSSPSLNRWRI